MSEARPTNYRHGAARSGRLTTEYRAWTRLRHLCRKAAQSAEPGTPVVTVCSAWDRDFSAFLAAVGPRPSPQHSLRRRDKQEGFEPGNCFWGIADGPGRRTKNVRMIEVGGRTVTVSEAAFANGLSTGTLLHRLDRGWTPDRAVQTPARSYGSRGA